MKQEIDHDEIMKTHGKGKNEWLPYLKNDVLSTALCYSRFSKAMEELTGFGLKNSLLLPSIANTYFNCLRDEHDEPFTLISTNICVILHEKA